MDGELEALVNLSSIYKTISQGRLVILLEDSVEYGLSQCSLQHELLGELKDIQKPTVKKMDKVRGMILRFRFGASVGHFEWGIYMLKVLKFPTKVKFFIFFYYVR